MCVCVFFFLSPCHTCGSLYCTNNNWNNEHPLKSPQMKLVPLISLKSIQVSWIIGFPCKTQPRSTSSTLNIITWCHLVRNLLITQYRWYTRYAIHRRHLRRITNDCGRNSTFASNNNIKYLILKLINRQSRVPHGQIKKKYGWILKCDSKKKLNYRDVIYCNNNYSWYLAERRNLVASESTINDGNFCRKIWYKHNILLHNFKLESNAEESMKKKKI